MKLVEGKTWRRLAWGVSAALWLVLLLGAFTYQRAELRLLPAEATVLMQARSLAEDGDLRYERLDFDRVLLQIVEPPDLELVSGTGGRTVTFDRPFPYALWLAPFVAWRAGTGFAVGNVLLLAAAALWCSWALARRSGSFGPIWVTAIVFASPIVTSVFRLDGDTFVVAAVLAAVGFALESGEIAGEQYRGQSGRFALAAGVCLSLAAGWEFVWLVLPLALLPLWRRGRRASGDGGRLRGRHASSGPRAVVGRRWTALCSRRARQVHHRDRFSLCRLSTTGVESDRTSPVSAAFRRRTCRVVGLRCLVVAVELAISPARAARRCLAVRRGRAGHSPGHRQIGARGSTPGAVVSLRGHRTRVVLLLLVFRPFRIFDAAALGPTPLLPLLALTPLVRATAPAGGVAPRRAIWALGVLRSLFRTLPAASMAGTALGG